LLYEALFRLTHGESRLLEDPSCEPVLTLSRMRRAVDHDVHQTHAFVRFQRMQIDGEEHYVAWHRPEHDTLELAAPHFVRRFATMRWSILTPDRSASWDLQTLRFGPGVARTDSPSGEPSEATIEGLWKTYYASIFNPARLNVRALRAELPVRHWSTLPEAGLIPTLVQSASHRAHHMVKTREPSPALELIPPHANVEKLHHAASRCLLCPWAAKSTQTVFGEGPHPAEVMLVGEQPGDLEDRQGKPFVGPAGQLLNEVLQQVGLPREKLYVTNAVKHFKYELKGKRRLHEKPSARDVHTCQGWLMAEVQAVKPRIIVALGATAGQAFLGPTFRLGRARGEFVETPWTSQWLATYHPAALLRTEEGAAREQRLADFQADLRKVAAAWRQAA
jgi:DNA polymerase